MAVSLLLRLHQIRENVINQRQVTPALRPQPDEDIFIQANANCLLPWPGIPESHHSRQLPIGQTRDVIEIDARTIPRGLSFGDDTDSLIFTASQSPALDIFGAHAFQPRGLR